MTIRYSITQEGPDQWVAAQWEDGFWPFRFGKWKPIDTFKTERGALVCIKNRAVFKPHTSYYDEHGTLLIEPTDW